jgi:predicted PurR-regulated permease PerM
MCIGFALVIAFWMLVDLPRLGREAYRLMGDARKTDAQMLHLTVTRVMGGYLKAMVIQCAIIGVACGILFACLGVPSPAALGTIAGLLNVIPIVGPWFGGGLAFIASVVKDPIVGVIALVGTVVIQQFVYTFVSPKIMGESVDIHPALTFLALMAGAGVGTATGGLMGALVGALLSIPLVAMLKSVFVFYFEKRTGRRIVAEDGVFFKGVPGEGDEVDPMADATAPVPAPEPPDTGRIPTLSDLTGKLPFVDSDSNDEEE